MATTLDQTAIEQISVLANSVGDTTRNMPMFPGDFVTVTSQSKVNEANGEIPEWTGMVTEEGGQVSVASVTRGGNGLDLDRTSATSALTDLFENHGEPVVTGTGRNARTQYWRVRLRVKEIRTRGTRNYTIWEYA